MEMLRNRTKEIRIGNVWIGGSHPVAIQSMTNTKTEDVAATVEQILALEVAGCEIIRCAVPTMEAALALKEIKKQIHIPLVADIHFDYRLAIAAIENGADKIRINPGNIGSKERVQAVVEKAKEYNVPIRVGVNSGSLEKNLLEKYGGVTAEGIVESALDKVRMIEYRRGLLPEPERECYISGNAFAKDWIKKVRDEVLDTPILVIAGGLFHYFEENKVIALLRMIGQFGNMEVVFDTVNRKGMAMMQKKYMRQVGHADAQMFFYVDAVEELAAKIGGNAKVIADEPYYRYIPKNGLKMSTKVSMAVSDRFCMVKMIQLKL